MNIKFIVEGFFNKNPIYSQTKISINSLQNIYLKFLDLSYTWEVKYVASIGQIPLYFGTAIYAFEARIHLENNLFFLILKTSFWNDVFTYFSSVGILVQH